jgi:hypothetical protein
MTDIVERLREWSEASQRVTGQRFAMLDEAADEIERLRSDITDLVKAAGEEATLAESLRKQLASQDRPHLNRFEVEP